MRETGVGEGKREGEEEEGNITEVRIEGKDERGREEEREDDIGSKGKNEGFFESSSCSIVQTKLNQIKLNHIKSNRWSAMASDSKRSGCVVRSSKIFIVRTHVYVIRFSSNSFISYDFILFILIHTPKIVFSFSALSVTWDRGPVF